MKTPVLAFAAALALTGALAPIAVTPAAAVQAAPKYTVNSSLAELMENPATKAILQKHLPDVVAQVEPYIGQIPAEFTLESLSQFGLDIPADKKAALDTELKAVG